MKTEITSVTVSTIWDDGSRSNVDISKNSGGDLGPFVSVTDDRQTVFFYKGRWPEIRDQIESMMHGMET